MRQSNLGPSLLWWSVFSLSVSVHGLWLYACSDWMLVGAMQSTTKLAPVPLALQVALTAQDAEAPLAVLTPSAAAPTPTPTPTPAPTPTPTITAAAKTLAQRPVRAAAASTDATQVSTALHRSLELAAARAQPDADSGPVAEAAPVVTSAPDYLAAPVSPNYPELARRRGWQGKVWLEIAVSAQGESGAPVVLQSSGFALLDEAAIAAAEQWRFKPERRAGRPVATRVQIPVAFALR